jgi:hypothetical protein
VGITPYGGDSTVDGMFQGLFHTASYDLTICSHCLFVRDTTTGYDLRVCLCRAGVLLIPLTIGAVFICVLDAMYTRQPHFDHQHYE